MTRAPVLLGLAGWSGSGKTTLAERLLPVLRARGLRVSTIKHTHHSVDLDRPGKDSFRHRAAGAEEVIVASEARWALLRETARPASAAELAGRLAPVDLVLVEGFKREAHDKIEVHRPALGKPPLWPDDPYIVAVASPTPLPDCPLPQLPLDEAERIAAFVVAHCGLEAAP